MQSRDDCERSTSIDQTVVSATIVSDIGSCIIPRTDLATHRIEVRTGVLEGVNVICNSSLPDELEYVDHHQNWIARFTFPPLEIRTRRTPTIRDDSKEADIRLVKQSHPSKVPLEVKQRNTLSYPPSNTGPMESLILEITVERT
jgi:hypothetical protein